MLYIYIDISRATERVIYMVLYTKGNRYRNKMIYIGEMNAVIRNNESEKKQKYFERTLTTKFFLRLLESREAEKFERKRCSFEKLLSRFWTGLRNSV